MGERAKGQGRTTGITAVLFGGPLVCEAPEYRCAPVYGSTKVGFRLEGVVDTGFVVLAEAR